jgi:precorrin-8X/cobalt-precorrin-8 methylmutase
LAHAAGDSTILDDLAWLREAVAVGRRALAAGAPILVDARMVAAGISRERLSAGSHVICTLPDAVEL